MGVLTGGCLCGDVRFELDGPLESAGWCHCTHCQRRTGSSASPQAPVRPGQVRVLRGAGSVRGFTPDVPGAREKCFCVRCGSHLWSRDPETHEIGGVRLGAFDEDPGVRPASRQFLRSAAAWDPVDPDDGLEHFDGRRGA